MPWPTAVDLFSGSGAVTKGLKLARFRVIAAVDNDSVSAETYRINHRNTHLYERDIRDVDPAEIRRTDLGGESVSLLVVCAPCQPFSSQRRGTEEDPRSKLIFQSIRFAMALSPRVILFENVPGLASHRFLNLLADLRSELASVGYVLNSPEKLDAANFGVPQRRVRCMVTAYLRSRMTSLEPLGTPLSGERSVRDAIGDLPRLRSGQGSEADPLHFARTHRPEALRRLRAIPHDGGSRSALPSNLELACHVGHSGHPDVYGRMAWDRVAPTLTTGCTDITRGRFAHPEDDRAISLREAARLQTFPDGYRFAGSPKAIARQIGNAVPIEMVRHIAKQLRTHVV